MGTNSRSEGFSHCFSVVRLLTFVFPANIAMQQLSCKEVLDSTSVLGKLCVCGYSEYFSPKELKSDFLVNLLQLVRGLFPSLQPDCCFTCVFAIYLS